MAKEDTSSLDSEPFVGDDIKDIMGLPPEEAEPALSEVGQSIVEPVGPPELTPDDSMPDTETEAPVNQDDPAPTDEPEPPVVDDSEVPIATEPKDTLGDADAVVDDIIAKEGDDLLAADDAKATSFEPSKKRHHIAHFFSAWWHNKRARTITILAIIGIIAALALVPYTRYKILNFFGVRASISLKVIDEKSGFPIKDVNVMVGGAQGTTNSDGNITLGGVLLGKTQLELTKRSFAPVSQSIVVGWGSNPYVDPFQMKAVGTSYVFIVNDALSGKPIAKAAVTDGTSSAVTGDDGKAVFTLQPNDSDITVTIKATDYRDEKKTITVNEKSDTVVTLLPGKPDIFVSKRSGKYDLYKRDTDGKNETVLMAGTGSEQESLSLLVHPSATTAAYVTSRDGKRNTDGYLLSNLYMVDVQGKTATKIDGTESEQIQLIDWVGDKLIFVKIVAGPSGNSAGRERLMTYDIKQSKLAELASANYFNDVEVFNDRIYYAISGAPQLIRINADSSSKTTILAQETWIMYRTAYDKMQASAANNKWYEQNLTDSSMTALAGAPANPKHRIYADNPSGDKSVWLDTRDGKGVLLLHDVKTPGEDKVIVTAPGLNYPVRWLSDKHLLVRISTAQETANYVLNIEGGDMKKIGDVTSTASTSRWYYY